LPFAAINITPASAICAAASANAIQRLLPGHAPPAPVRSHRRSL